MVSAGLKCMQKLSHECYFLLPSKIESRIVEFLSLLWFRAIERVRRGSQTERIYVFHKEIIHNLTLVYHLLSEKGTNFRRVIFPK